MGVPVLYYFLRIGGAIMTESRFDIGMKVRKEVLGSEHVEGHWKQCVCADARGQQLLNTFHIK